jgi:Sulfotransferase family
VTDALPISFAIVGVQKAATSTLHSMLVRHRHIARGDAKELHFFDDERLDWAAPDYTRYHVRRTHAAQRIAGDATPSYIWWPGALSRMHAYNPDMRLVASFRDPIERAFSQWSMERKRQPSYPGFSRSIEIFGDLSLLGGFPPGKTSREVRRAAMVVRGLYGEQLRRGLAVYDRSQWLLLPFRRFVAEPESVLDDIAGFLDIGEWHNYPLQRENPTPRDQAGPPPTADDMLRLTDVYADDLALFASLSGIDVSSWPTTRIAAGTLAPADLAADLARKVGLLRED